MSPLHWLSVCCFVVCGWCAGDSFHQQAQAHLEALRKTLVCWKRCIRKSASAAVT